MPPQVTSSETLCPENKELRVLSHECGPTDSPKDAATPRVPEPRVQHP